MTVCSLLFLQMGIVAAQEIENIAVTEFEARNVSQMDALTISDLLRTELVRTNLFNVVERKNMEKLLSEQKFQISGCTTQECAVQMGRILGVRKIVIGSLNKLAGVYYIQANIVDVETGRIIAAEKVKCIDETRMGDEIENLSRGLVAAYKGIKIAPPPTPPEEVPVPAPVERVPPEVKPAPAPLVRPVARAPLPQEGEFFYTYQRLSNVDDIFSTAEEVKQTLFNLYLRAPLGKIAGFLFYNTYRSFTYYYSSSYYGGTIKDEYNWAQNFLQAMLYFKLLEGVTPEGPTKFDWLIAGGVNWLNGAWADWADVDKYAKTDFTAYTEAKIPLGKYFTIRSFYSFINATPYTTKYNYSFYGVDFLVNFSPNLTTGFGYQINLQKPTTRTSSTYKDFKLMNFSLRIRWR